MLSRSNVNIAGWSLFYFKLSSALRELNLCAVGARSLSVGIVCIRRLVSPLITTFEEAPLIWTWLVKSCLVCIRERQLLHIGECG
ncbi:hypothetical protein K1719_008632 [Acacia pycnantha]|nr:hypothetical protein K1719_008632 [Acacia pycnantha]